MSLLIQNKSWGDSILDTCYILCPQKQRFRGIYCPRFDIQIHLSFPPPLGHLNSYAAHALNMHRKLLSFNPSNIFHTLDSWAPCSLWRLTLWLPRKFTPLTQNFTKFQGKCQNVSNNKKELPNKCVAGDSQSWSSIILKYSPSMRYWRNLYCSADFLTIQKKILNHSSENWQKKVCHSSRKLGYRFN